MGESTMDEPAKIKFTNYNSGLTENQLSALVPRAVYKRRLSAMNKNSYTPRQFSVMPRGDGALFAMVKFLATDSYEALSH